MARKSTKLNANQTVYTIKDGSPVVINTNYGSATLTLVFPTIWKRTA